MDESREHHGITIKRKGGISKRDRKQEIEKDDRCSHLTVGFRMKDNKIKFDRRNHVEMEKKEAKDQEHMRKNVYENRWLNSYRTRKTRKKRAKRKKQRICQLTKRRKRK